MSAYTRTYAAYLESLAVLGDLPEVRRAAEIEAERLGQDNLNRALQNEHDFRTRQRELEERLRRLRRPVNQLVSSSGAPPAAPLEAVPDEMAWEHLLRGVDSLTRELAAGERDAQWLQRNRTYTPPTAPSTPPPMPVAPPPPVTQTPTQEQSTGRLALTPLGWAAIAALVVLAIVAALLLI